MYPLSRFFYSTPLLIALSIALVIAQMFLLDNADVLDLWLNWCAAGVASAGIWQLTKLYHLCGTGDGKISTITWPLLSACLNFAYIYFPGMRLHGFDIVLLLVMIAAMVMLLSLWQGRATVGRHLLLGIAIGLISTLLPHALLWLLLLPLVDYHMRCWNLRNALGAITGALLGIWVVYSVLFLSEHLLDVQLVPFSAQQLLMHYTVFFHLPDFSHLMDSFRLWHWLFLGLMLLMVFIYSISSNLLNISNSVRTGASISLISTLSGFMILLTVLDTPHLSLYLCLLSLFLCIQLTIHQANLHSAVNEWWTLVIILTFMSLTALPLWV